MIIKLVGRLNDLELGKVEDGAYHELGLLADDAHRWKILAWIDQNLGDGIKVVKVLPPAGKEGK